MGLDTKSQEQQKSHEHWPLQQHWIQFLCSEMCCKPTPWLNEIMLITIKTLTKKTYSLN